MAKGKKSKFISLRSNEINRILTQRLEKYNYINEEESDSNLKIKDLKDAINELKRPINLTPTLSVTLEECSSPSGTYKITMPKNYTKLIKKLDNLISPHKNNEQKKLNNLKKEILYKDKLGLYHQYYQKLKNDIDFLMSYRACGVFYFLSQDVNNSESLSEKEKKLFERFNQIKADKLAKSGLNRSLSIIHFLFLFKIELEENNIDNYEDVIDDLLDCFLSYLEEGDFDIENEFNIIVSRTQDPSLRNRLILFKEKIIENNFFSGAFFNSKGNYISYVEDGFSYDEIKKIKDDFLSKIQIGKNITSIPKIVTKDSELMLKATKKNYLLFSQAHRSLKYNLETVTKAVQINGMVYAEAEIPKEIRSNKSIALEALKTKDIIEHVPPELKKDESFWRDAIKGAKISFDIKGIPKLLVSDEELMKDAVKINFYNIKYASENIREKLLSDEYFIRELIGKGFSPTNPAKDFFYPALNTGKYDGLLTIRLAINDLTSKLDKKNPSHLSFIKNIEDSFSRFCCKSIKAADFSKESKDIIEKSNLKKQTGLKFLFDTLLKAIVSLFKHTDNNYSFFSRTQTQNAVFNLEKSLNEGELINKKVPI